MARIKSPVLNSRPAPKLTSQEVPEQAKSVERDSSSSAPPSSSKTCPHCEDIFDSYDELDNHVASCPRPGTAESGSSSPLSFLERSPTPPSDSTRPQAVDEDAGGDDAYPETDVGDDQEEEEDLPLPELSLEHIHDEAVNGISNGVTSSDRNYFSDDEDVADELPHQVEVQLSSPKSGPSSYPNISAYTSAEVETMVDGKMVTHLEYEMEVYEIGAENVLTNEQRDEEIEAAINSEAPEITDGVNEIEALVTSADTEAILDASDPTDEAPGAVTETEIEDRPELEEVIADDDSAVASGTQERKVVSLNTSITKFPKKFSFKKLTSLADIQAYMSNLEDMSYEEVYHRAEQVSFILKELQDEYEELDMEYEENEVYTKSKQKEANKALKELEEARLKEEEPHLIEVLLKYEEQLKTFKEKPWKDFMEGIVKSGLPTNDPDAFKRLKRLRDDPKLRDNISKRIQESRNPKPVVNLEGVPLPKLTAEDLKNDQVRKKNRLMDPLEFEDKRQQDVYGLTWSSAANKRGNQLLIDRNTVDENGEPVNDNGRPKRTGRKRTLYETDASEAPSAEEEEVLPAKRRRNQKIPGGADIYGMDQSNTQSRAESPPPRTFASGKRIGRPRGSRTKPKPLKSKLNETHVPPESENDENPDEPSPSSDEVVGKTQQGLGGPGNRELAAAEETQLYDSAKALIDQTLSDQGVMDTVPVKRKHAGGRPKKNAAVKAESASFTNLQSVSPTKSKAKGARKKKQSENPGENEAPAKKNPRGGRAGKKAAVLDDIQLGDQDDLLPSTEQDDESRFASASTSRPTTSSSRVTESTLGSRRSARAVTRGASKAQGSVGVEDDGPAVSTRAKAGNKRKRNAGESSVEVAGDLETLDASPRKRRKNAAKSQQLPDVKDDVLAVEPPPMTRQKRKRAGTAADSIEVLGPDHVDIDDLQDSEPPAKKKRARLVGKRAKAVKVETESDFGEDEADTLPHKVSTSVNKKGKSDGNHLSESDLPNDYDGEPDNYNDSGDDTAGPVIPLSKKKRAPAKRSNGRKKAQTKKKGSESVAADRELDEEALALLEAKRKQKSEKLSASAKARWARGDMDEPMKKRARTNAAKNAAKKAAKLGLQGPNLALGSSMTEAAGTPPVLPAQDAFAQQPAAEQVSIQQDLIEGAPAPAPRSKASKASAPKAPSSKVSPQSAVTPAPTKRSTRERKPSRLALGMDGAGDEDDFEVQSRFKSEYEHYQALTSPRSPIVLGKRNRKSIYDLSNLQDDDDEDFI